MATEADEHERALAVEISFQRRQWDKMRELGDKMDKQAAKVLELERKLQEQTDLSRSMEDALKAQRSEAQAAVNTLHDRCTEEHDARESEFHSIRLMLKSLEGKCEELIREERDSRQTDLHGVRLSHKTLEGKCEEIREATRELPGHIQKSHQELHSSKEAFNRRHDDLLRDLGGRCKDLEKLISEERTARGQELKSTQALVNSLQSGQDELDRSSAREREARKQECQELRSDLEQKCSQMVRETTKDLSKLINSKHQECSDLYRDFGNRCKDLSREVGEDREARQRDHMGVRGALSELERRFGELLREVADEVNEKQANVTSRSERVGQALKELATRVDDLEHNMQVHTHSFTSTKTYKCGPPRSGADLASASLRLRSPGPTQPDGLSTISTVAGSEPL